MDGPASTGTWIIASIPTTVTLHQFPIAVSVRSPTFTRTKQEMAAVTLVPPGMTAGVNASREPGGELSYGKTSGPRICGPTQPRNTRLRLPYRRALVTCRYSRRCEGSHRRLSWRAEFAIVLCLRGWTLARLGIRISLRGMLQGVMLAIAWSISNVSLLDYGLGSRVPLSSPFRTGGGKSEGW